MKHIKLLGLAVLSLSCISATVPLNDEPPVPGSVIHYVDFFNNFNRQEFTLSNGTTGKGNNMIFKTIEVNGEHPIAKPEEEPARPNYEFQGWYKEEECINEWNFESDVVLSNLRHDIRTQIGKIMREFYTY